MNLNQTQIKYKDSYAKTYYSNKVSFLQPFLWLWKGFLDFCYMPIISIFFGSCFFLASYTIKFLLETNVTEFSPHLIIISSLILFALIGPFLALGLYQASWDKSRNKKPTLFRSIKAINKNAVAQWSFAILLSVFMIFWLRTISLAHVFYPIVDNAPLSDYSLFFIFSGVISLIFLIIVFTLSAFSIPLMLERKVDLMTAIFSSINAVKTNFLSMLVWGIIILTTLSISFFINLFSLIILMPIIGYATWHSFKDTINLKHN